MRASLGRWISSLWAYIILLDSPLMLDCWQCFRLNVQTPHRLFLISFVWTPCRNVVFIHLEHLPQMVCSFTVNTAGIQPWGWARTRVNLLGLLEPQGATLERGGDRCIFVSCVCMLAPLKNLLIISENPHTELNFVYCRKPCPEHWNWIGLRRLNIVWTPIWGEVLRHWMNTTLGGC